MRALALLLAVASCTGGIGDGVDEPSGGATDQPRATGGSGPTPTPPKAMCTASAGPAPVRRLTRREYDNTVRDLLGDTSGPSRDFPADGRAAQFESNVDSPLNANLANDYFNAAETLAARANLDTVVPCKPATAADELGCARQFIATFGKRAYRRPLVTTETARFESQYSAARTRGHTFVTATRLLISTMLQSPHFLNHVEKGAAPSGAGPAALTPYELASRLSYFLWQTMPDQMLFAAADGGRLVTAADVEREARRLLADAKGKSGALQFYRQWLELEKLDDLQKSKTAYPQWSTTLATSMRSETESYVTDVVGGTDPRLETLLGAHYSFINSTLAKLYGMSGGDATFKRTDLDPKQRGGFLTHGSFLATHAYSDQSDPVHRGKFVREALLCMHTPSPDPNIQAMIHVPAVDPKATTRQRWEALFTGNDVCLACHRMMNPIGFSMEGYDGIGTYRTMENGQPIDASGELVATDIDGTFNGVLELEGRLARSGQVRDCLALQSYVYALGRNDTPADHCPLDKLYGDFAASGGNLRELVVAVSKSDGFRFRAPVTPEVCK